MEKFCNVARRGPSRRNWRVVKCDVFDKVLSNQYQMDSASIFVIAAQNMPQGF